jgi:hypothetical protein
MDEQRRTLNNRLLGSLRNVVTSISSPDGRPIEILDKGEPVKELFA